MTLTRTQRANVNTWNKLTKLLLIPQPERGLEGATDTVSQSIDHFYITNNTRWLLPKILRENCLQFLFGIGIRSKNGILRQFPNCPKPLFQSEAKCKAIDKKLLFFIPMQIDFFFSRKV